MTGSPGRAGLAEHRPVHRWWSTITAPPPTGTLARTKGRAPPAPLTAGTVRSKTIANARGHTPLQEPHQLPVAECVTRSRQLRDHFSSEDLQAVIDLYSSGITAKQVAEKFNVNLRSVNTAYAAKGGGTLPVVEPGHGLVSGCSPSAAYAAWQIRTRLNAQAVERPRIGSTRNRKTTEIIP
jgi:hypothetical protein